jgi:hypothetical protein
MNKNSRPPENGRLNSQQCNQANICAQAPDPIREPGLIAKADECLKFVAELENTLQRIDGFLFVYKPQPADEVCNSASSVDDTLARISTRLACLVGHTRTILSRIED